MKKIILTLIVVYLLFGCTTYHSPKIRIDTDQKKLSNITLGLKIITDNNNNNNREIYLSEELLRKIQKTGLFKNVYYSSEFIKQQPDLEVQFKPQKKHLRCMTGEASLMVLTLGLFPLNLSHEKHCIFDILNPKTGSRVTVNIEEKLTGYMGSAISLLNILPSWSFNYDQSSHDMQFKNELYSKCSELLNNF